MKRRVHDGHEINGKLIDNRYVPEELGEWIEDVVKAVH